jgi:hypothetical protein
VNPAESFCAQKAGPGAAAEGAPLVFATQLAYELTCTSRAKKGLVDLPVKADPSQGGLVLLNIPRPCRRAI